MPHLCQKINKEPQYLPGSQHFVTQAKRITNSLNSVTSRGQKNDRIKSAGSLIGRFIQLCLIALIFQVLLSQCSVQSTAKNALPPAISMFQFSSVQPLSRARFCATLWIAAHQASLSITNSWSLLKLMSIESVMPSNHLILCRPLLLPPSLFPSIRVLSNESVYFHTGWHVYFHL